MKKNLLGSSLLLLLLLMLSPWVKGQDVSEWTFLKETEGIRAFYQKTNCSGESKILFKVQNSSNVTKELIWNGFIKNGDEFVASLMTMPPQILESAQEKFGACGDDIDINLSLPIPLNFNIEDLTIEITLVQ